MDIKHQPQFAPFDFFLIRRPNFPVNLFVKTGQSGSDKGVHFIEFFKNCILKEPEFLIAIYVASPVLFERARKWIDGEIISEEESLLKTLYKYFGRICTRSTPYGLFSGVALAGWGGQTAIEVDRAGDRPFVELDILIINRLAELALLDDCVRENALFFSNNSIYKVGSGFRYVEYDLDQGVREYFISSVQNFEALEPVLALARNGCYLRDIRQELAERGYSPSEAEDCITDFIDLKIIQNEFETQIIDSNSLTILIDQMRKSNADVSFLSGLEQIANSLKVKGKLSIESLTTVRDLLNEMLTSTSENIQVQLTLQQKYETAQISTSIKNRIEKDLRSIAPLFGKKPKTALTDFKKQFTERYGEAEMPLSIILDGELGIDYGDTSRLSSTPVLDGLELVPLGDGQREFTTWDRFLLNIYLRFMEEKTECINLTKNDFNLFSPIAGAPPSFYAIGNLFDLMEDSKFNLNYVGGNSGITLLSRFAASNDALREKLQEIADYEQQCYHDAVLAEIVFFPKSRTANVLSHPSFYSFEIPFITRSSVPESHQLPVDDLTVSVKGGKQVILRSKKLGKQVIPRLSNAHNYSSELPVYRFLCDIQTDSDEINFLWNWSLLEDRPVLPRVVFNSLILSRKTWNVNVSWAGRLDEFIHLYDVPQYVQLVDRDNEMLLDLHLPLAQSILADELKKKGKAELKEFLSAPEQCVVNDNDGNRYANELVIPFKTNHFQMRSPETGYAGETVTRKFAPGDDWLYVKIYSGPTILDRLLVDIIGQLAKELEGNGTIDKWFFIRFQDPFHHLRLRFYKPGNPEFAGTVLEMLKQKLAQMRADGMIERFAIDTYDRELERYGPDNIEMAESLFFMDSRFVINILREIADHELDDSRWLYACLGVHAVLEAFGLDLKQKLALMTTSFENFLGEYQQGDKLLVQLNQKFRSSRPDITRLIEQYQNSSEDRIVELFAHHAIEIKELMTSSTTGFSGAQIGAILHMFCNRLLIGESRGQELLIYHSLSKFYNGRDAQERRTKSSP